MANSEYSDSMLTDTYNVSVDGSRYLSDFDSDLFGPSQLPTTSENSNNVAQSEPRETMNNITIPPNTEAVQLVPGDQYSVVVQSLHIANDLQSPWNTGYQEIPQAETEALDRPQVVVANQPERYVRFR